jgi:sugar lactone lactonase YvrE
LTDVHCIQAANAALGESPTWDVDQGALYWVDGERPAIFRWEPRQGQTGHWPMPKSIGCVASAGPGRLLFADAESLGFLNTLDGAISRIPHPEAPTPRSRLNDGKVDRAGRFWVGTMDEQELCPIGSLYRLDADLRLSCQDRGFICSNGLGWSPDDRTMYFTDSVARTIWAYEFDLRSGDLGARRVFATLSDDDGMPDGLTVDSEGYVWSAIWDGWRVIRYAPDGSVDREIHVPAQRPSSCMLGGRDLKTLLITSARTGLGAAELENGPLAGALFAVSVGVAGLAETRFGA